jgi:hypothetical protein
MRRRAGIRESVDAGGAMGGAGLEPTTYAV